MQKFFVTRGRKLLAVKKVEDISKMLTTKTEVHRLDPSAERLAAAWLAAKGIPTEVAGVLEASPTFRGCKLIEGLFERETSLSGRGSGTFSDLILAVKLQKGRATIVVEGRLDEGMGPPVGAWVEAGAEYRQLRIDALCDILELDPGNVSALPYELLERAVALLLEAQEASSSTALLLVHSFDPGDTGLHDFLAFAQALGARGEAKNRIWGVGTRGPIRLYLGWVSHFG